MLSVASALTKVMKEVECTELTDIPLSQSCGHRVAEAVYAPASVPQYPTSIMDGYAVIAPIKRGKHRVSKPIRAGDSNFNENSTDLAQVSYITTGARLYPPYNSVIKVEDTTSLAKPQEDHDNMNNSNEIHKADTNKTSLYDSEVFVQLNVDCEDEDVNVRQVGSDIMQGELLLDAGHVIGPIEIGLLASVGITTVTCHRRPIVGVISTGNELVDIDSNQPLNDDRGQIYDTNRLVLVNSFRSNGGCGTGHPNSGAKSPLHPCHVIDFGITKDTKQAIKDTFLTAQSCCDIVITTGGVSMGDADLVKPLLEELGDVHFGRLNMKPGKPTTFASMTRREYTPARANLSSPSLLKQRPCLLNADEGQKVYFFGLPGNPVSSLVTKALFVEPALRRLQGLGAAQCLHLQCKARLVGANGERATNKGKSYDIKMDRERVEYHRGTMYIDAYTNEICVKSTGNQRSSRLASMLDCNALIYIPQANPSSPSSSNIVAVGSMVDILLLEDNNVVNRMGLLPPQAFHSLHKQAALSDESDSSTDREVQEGLVTIEKMTSFDNLLNGKSVTNTSHVHNHKIGNEDVSSSKVVEKRSPSTTNASNINTNSNSGSGGDNDGDGVPGTASDSATMASEYMSFTSLSSLQSMETLDAKRAMTGTNTNNKSKNGSKDEPQSKLSINVALLTISDRASEGTYADESGPLMQTLLEDLCKDKLDMHFIDTAIVPDDVEKIRRQVKAWSIDDRDNDSNTNKNSKDIQLILTSGGTGFGLRDHTPEAIEPLLHRKAPGVAQALLNEGLKYTPLAVLSRPVCGTINRTFIATLPGSTKAVRENIKALQPLLPRIMELLKEGTCH